MKTIGITGNIGSGKSSVAKIIADKGYRVIFSDLMLSNKKIQNKLIERFGKEIYIEFPESQKILNVDLLSELTFGDNSSAKENLSELNKIVHPEVIDYIENKLNKLEEEGVEICFVESALIYEANLEEAFDFIIVVHSEPETSYNRIKNRNFFSEKKFNAIENEQIPRSEKKKLADFVILNEGSIEELKKATEFILNILR